MPRYFSHRDVENDKGVVSLGTQIKERSDPSRTQLKRPDLDNGGTDSEHTRKKLRSD